MSDDSADDESRWDDSIPLMVRRGASLTSDPDAPIADKEDALGTRATTNGHHQPRELTSGEGSPNPAVVSRRALSWANERDYAGYDPYDGLNSPILSMLSRHWILRLLAMHGVRAAPLNLRPLLRVPRERNPKGIGLFAQAYLNRYERTGDQTALRRAEELLAWLRSHESRAVDAPAWGYNFDWQNSNKFFLPAGHPCGVVSVFCARAFLQHYRLTGDSASLATARGVCDFLLTDLNTRNIRGRKALTYTPYDDYIAVNANALAASLLFGVGQQMGVADFLERADELFAFVIEMQAGEGGWHYAVPASDSLLGFDNFHTGFVLESLYPYAKAKGENHLAMRSYEQGLAFHRRVHFEPDGAPKFEDTSAYPYDVHAAAQAIITFSQRRDQRDRELARRVLDWTLESLYREEGSFECRIGRFVDDRTVYMRWNQAWMCLALSEYLLAEHRMSH